MDGSFSGIMDTPMPGLTNGYLMKWAVVPLTTKTKNSPNAPEYTYNVGAEYVHDTGYFGRLDLLGVGGFYTDAKNTTWVSPYEVVTFV